MDVRYEVHFWRPLIKRTFPAMPKYRRTRADLSKRFNQIRELRNRIFHHERIWDWGYNGRNLVQQHADIVEAIGWISPTLRDTLALFDRFPEIYRDGPAPFKAKLTAYEAALPH